MAYSNDLRVSAVTYFLSHDFRYKDVAPIFGVGVATLHGWVSTYKESGRIESKSPTGRPRLLQGKQDSAFQEMITTNKDMTLEQLSEAWEAHQGQKLNIMYISRTLRRLGITRKKRHFAQQKEKAKPTSRGVTNMFLV